MAMVEDFPEQVPGFEQTPVEMYRPQVLVKASLSEHEPYERQALLAWLIDAPKDFNLDQVSEVEQTYKSLINAATDGRHQLVERSVYLESAFQILQEVDGYCGSDGVIPQDELEREAPGLVGSLQLVKELIPTYFESPVYLKPKMHGLLALPEHLRFAMTEDRPMSTIDIFSRLINVDGWSDACLIPPEIDEYGYGEDETSVWSECQNAPLGVFMLVDALISDEGKQLSTSLYSGDFFKLAEVALDFQSERFQQSLASKGHILANDDIARTILRARAFRTSHWGDDHLGSLGLLKDMNNEVSQGSLESLGRLTTSARRLQGVFPGETAEAVDEGAQRLIANLAYASSTTTFLKGLNTSIELTGGHALPVVALDTDGITLPLILSHTIDHLAELTRRDSVRAVKCAAGAGFMLWRFIDLDHNLPMAASLNIRPLGATNYDPTYEFGRPNEGVEASISYTVDTNVLLGRSSGMVELSKKTDNEFDGRISIRLDREGVEPDLRGQADVVRDPTQQQGTVSLDIGSVGGKLTSMGTRIGRFIAFGNSQRSRVQKELYGYEQPIGLNHITSPFAEELGDATKFAAMALQLNADLERRQATSAEMQEFLSRLQA